MYTLFAHPHCPYAQRALIFAQLIQLPESKLKVEMINFSAPLAEVIAINSDWTVPMLANTETGIGFDDSLTIIEFLDSLAPSANKIFPSDPFARARTKFRNRKLCTSFVRPLKEIVYSFGNKLGESERHQQILSAYEFLNTEIGNEHGAFFGNDNLNASDVVVASFVMRLLAARDVNRAIPMPKAGSRARQYLESIANNKIVQKVCGEVPALAKHTRTFSEPPMAVQNARIASTAVLEKQTAESRSGWITIEVSGTHVLTKTLEFGTPAAAQRAMRCIASLESTADHKALIELDGNKSANIMLWTSKPYPHLTEKDVAFALAIDALEADQFSFGNPVASAFD